MNILIRKSFILAVVLTALLPVSCNYEACPTCEEELRKLAEGQNNVELTVSMNPSEKETKGLPQDETALHSAVLYVFESETGFLHSSYKDAQGRFSLTLANGRYDFAVLVNTPDVNPATRSELKGSVSRLSSNRRDSFVMYGYCEDVDILTSRTLSVGVHRLVSKVEYTLTVDWLHRAYETQEFHVKGAYMTNVPAETALDDDTYEPQEWYNKMYYASSEVSGLLFGPENRDLVNGDVLDSDHTFYIYPNRSKDVHVTSSFTPRCTRLVIEATLDGETYYYPVTLKDVGSNMAYDVDLTVRGPGMAHPEDEEVAAAMLDVTIRISDWETGETIDAVL